MKNKRVLIVGNLYALVKRLASDVEEVFVAPGNREISKIATCVDIREDSPNELLKFALENNIYLTIAVSEKAIKSDIASVFQANEMKIFAPSADSAECVLSKSACKKFLYKMHINTPKFGIFEKLQLAVDYLEEANFPLVVSADSINSQKYCCTSFERAKYHVEDLFLSGESKVVIQDYVYGSEFSVYVVSDGYHAVPLTSVKNFKFSENGDGGILTNGIGAYIPDGDISLADLNKIFNEIFNKSLKTLEERKRPYVGILGADIVFNKDKFSVLNFKPFFSDIDAQGILNLLDEDLVDLFDACANGFFADEYDDVIVNSNISAACYFKPRFNDFVLPDSDMIDSEISKSGNDYVITACAKTLSRAKKILNDDIKKIGADKIRLRSDIFEY